jgi:hypothetical protein
VRLPRLRFALSAGLAGGLLLACPATATSIRVFSYEEVEDLAAESTDVVRATFVRWERRGSEAAGREADGSFSVPELYGSPALSRLHVEEVLSGEARLAGREIVVLDSSRNGLETFARTGAVLFLRRDGERFWPVRFAVFRATNQDVDIPLPGRGSVPVKELGALVRKVTPVRVTWTGTAAPAITTGGTLHVELVAKNEGPLAAAVLPPSYCASVKVYPLADDERWHPRRERWVEVPSAWFEALHERMAVLARGEERVFRYEVPLPAAKMDRPGRYDVVLGMTESFCSVPPTNGAGAPRVLPNYMPDRVLRVEVTGTEDAGGAVSHAPVDEEPRPVAALPRSPPPHGCGSCTASGQRDGATSALVYALGVLLLLLPRDRTLNSGRSSCRQRRGTAQEASWWRGRRR